MGLPVMRHSDEKGCALGGSVSNVHMLVIRSSMCIV